MIAIVGMLIALLLPALQSAREVARRSTCGNNTKQIGLACQSFLASQQHFPSGSNNTYLLTPTSSPGSFLPLADWMVQILPHVEQGSLFSGIDMTKGYNIPDSTTGTRNNVLQKTHVPTFLCPSSGHLPALGLCCVLLPGDEDYSAVSYSAVADHVLSDTRSGSGVIFCQSRITAAHVRDGLSQTLLIAESYQNYDSDWKNFRCAVPSTCVMSRGWSFGNGVTTAYGINRRQPLSLSNTGPWITGINSLHAGGATCGMADGSTRFIADSIADSTLLFLTTRKPGFIAGETPVTDF